MSRKRGFAQSSTWFRPSCGPVFLMDPRSISTNAGMTTRGYLWRKDKGGDGRSLFTRKTWTDWSGSGWLLMDSRKAGELETRIRRYDGVYRWFLIRVVPLLDEQGNVVKWFGSNTDIEDRKRAEEKLRARRARASPDYRRHTPDHCYPGPGRHSGLREPGSARLYRPHHGRRDHLGLSRTDLSSRGSREAAGGAPGGPCTRPPV